jgi:hypothetical protein
MLAAALLILLALGAPVHADDPIAEWLKQDESHGQDNQVRPDLHALTDEQLDDIFKVGREHADGDPLIERGSAERPHVVYVWLAMIVAAFAVIIGAVKTAPFVRRRLRTLALPVWRDRAKKLWGKLCVTGRASDKATKATGRARHILEKAEAIVAATAEAEPKRFGGFA